jgi:polynucleotide 5'-kinase involved in rRNA processing
LERQLLELCTQLDIDESTPLETLVGDWDQIFKDNVMSFVIPSYRSLIARWLKWALMVHHLREELARYTAVGVVGLVNSGKSLLVSTLFDIEVHLHVLCS